MNLGVSLQGLTSTTMKVLGAAPHVEWIPTKEEKIEATIRVR